MIVVVCPGQGSQTPGFLDPWVSEPVFRDQLVGMSDAVGIDLVTHGTISDIDTIRDTAIAQPLIVAAGLLTLSVLLADGRRSRLGGIAGHSVGEVTAAAGAGILTNLGALAFVRERSRGMADAAAASATGMSAVIGAGADELAAKLDELGLEAANYNGGGQTVVAGALDALGRLKDAPPTGARVIPLQVAGAFHTRFMKPAVDRLGAFSTSLTPSDPTIAIWTNRDGTVVDSGSRYLELLVAQLTAPVRWDRTMAAFQQAGVTGVIEIAPAGALAGLLKRGLKGVPTVAIKTPDDLPSAFELIDAAA